MSHPLPYSWQADKCTCGIYLDSWLLCCGGHFGVIVWVHFAKGHWKSMQSYSKPTPNEGMWFWRMVLHPSSRVWKMNSRFKSLVWLSQQGKLWEPAHSIHLQNIFEQSTIPQANMILSDRSQVLKYGYVLMNSGRRHRFLLYKHNR